MQAYLLAATLGAASTHEVFFICILVHANFEFKCKVKVKKIQLECVGVKKLNVSSPPMELLDEIDVEDGEMDWCPVTIDLHGKRQPGSTHLVMKILQTHGPFAAVRNCDITADDA